MDLCERAGADPSAARHPWETARLRHVRRILARELQQRTTVLDVGSGDGFAATELVAAFPQFQRVVCCDINYTDADLAAGAASAAVVRVSSLPEGTFDVLLLLDVIEHVADSVGFLRDLREGNTGPGSVALVTVPAYPRLFSEHDRALGHFRRYTARSLRADLEQAGWNVSEVGGFFVLPLLARWGQVLLAPRSRSSARPANLAEWRGGSAMTFLAACILRADAALGRMCSRAGWRLPGLSLWAVAHPGSP